jgi:hypothetical protein
MAGVGEQRQRAEPDAHARLDERAGEREDEGDQQRPAMTAGRRER